jgi:PPOX class probable F420-dependent enzyme
LLESTALAHIATLGPRGEPQSSPVWFGWDGDYVKFSQIKTRQKYKNLNRDPRLALSIVDPENHLRYLEIRGVVDRIEEDPDLDFINSMSKKYLGKDRYPNHRPGDERVVVFVRPKHTTKKDR